MNILISCAFRTGLLTLSFFALHILARGGQLRAQTAYLPGHRTVVDAHNCYPYDGRWDDRIDRALSIGTPIAIEEDLNWYPPVKGTPGKVVVGHGRQHTALTKGGELTGVEPAFEEYFFGRVRPLVERALKSQDHSNWPLITLNLDFKTEDQDLLKAVWAILESHRTWLTTATKTTDQAVTPLTLGPILVLNGPSDQQQAVFYDQLAQGDELLTFGAVHTNMQDLRAAASVVEAEPASTYRRWWNNPWTIVEPEGQDKVGQWSPKGISRLSDLIAHAHAQGLWIRFYTLDGATEAEQKELGWFHQYNFPSQQEAESRWKSSISLGVDYLATDQYEGLARIRK